MTEEIFDIVDENDEIIGTATRKEAHQKGLLHRTVHVLFITPDKKVIFQRRSEKKDMYPGYLTITVSGHGISGSSYAETAIIEIEEETGIKTNLQNIYPIKKIRNDVIDPITQSHDSEWIMIYGYIYKGDHRSLKILEDDGEGFECYSIDDILCLTEEKQKQMKLTPMLYGEGFYVPLYQEFLKLLEEKQ